MEHAMKAAVLHSAREVRVEERPVPAIGRQDVLVRVEYVGICGSDMTLFNAGYIGDSVVNSPMVLGHEVSGVVAQTGSDVTSIAVGDRVALEPGVPCRSCSYCWRGLYNLCPSMYFWASLPVTEGALQTFVSHPATHCFKLPDNVSLIDGALVEPLSVAIHAVRQTGVAVGDRAVILGGGGLGQLLLAVLKATGLTEIYVSDPVQQRLDDVLSFADKRVSVFGSVESVEIGEYGPDIVFDASGSPSAINRAIDMVRPGGTVALVGYGQSGMADVNVNKMIDKEVSVRTAFRYRHIYADAIASLSQGVIDLSPIKTRVFPFVEVLEALTCAVDSKHSSAKYLVRVASPEEGE